MHKGRILENKKGFVLFIYSYSKGYPTFLLDFFFVSVKPFSGQNPDVILHLTPSVVDMVSQ